MGLAVSFWFYVVIMVGQIMHFMWWKLIASVVMTRQRFNVYKSYFRTYARKYNEGSLDSGKAVSQAGFFRHFMFVHFVERNYFGKTNWELLHPTVSMKDRWICSRVEPLESGHCIWISIGLYLGGGACFVLYFMSVCMWCQGGIPCLAI